MSDTERFLSLMKFNGNVLTLGEILRTHFAAEYRKHITLIRKMGHKVTCELNRNDPSKNLYRLEEIK